MALDMSVDVQEVKEVFYTCTANMAVVDAVQQHSLLGGVVVDAHRFLLLDGRHRIELVDIVDPEDMGGTNLANQIVPLRVVMGLGVQGMVVVIILAPFHEVYVLVKGRWRWAGKCTGHTAQAVW